VYRTTTRAEVIKYSEELKSTQRKTISRSLLATYMHSGLHSLQRSTVKSDKIALTIDLLNIYRQGYHQFRQQTTNKNLKHFFRMLTLEDKAKAQQLIQAFEEALAGNITKFVDLMKIWLDTEELVSVKNGTLKNGVFLGEQ
jgi:vacuolar-type H+-ATPase subunit D/Vma8